MVRCIILAIAFAMSGCAVVTGGGGTMIEMRGFGPTVTNAVLPKAAAIAEQNCPAGVAYVERRAEVRGRLVDRWNNPRVVPVTRPEANGRVVVRCR